MPTHLDVGKFYYWCEICRHICQHICSCSGKYFDMSRCRHISRHIKMLPYMPTHWDVGKFYWYWKYADVYVNTFVLVMVNVLTCTDADTYAVTLRCWHICQHIEMSAHSTSIKNMSTYISTHFFGCWQICRHIQMPTHMSTYGYGYLVPGHWDADICRHFDVNMPTVALAC